MCPYCAGLVPLSPNWRLAPGGIGIRLRPQTSGGPSWANRVCTFEVVHSAGEQSEATVRRGTGLCPYPDCGRVIDGGEIKQQAQDGEMGEQLYAVVYKKRIKKFLKSGRRGKDKWVRGYRGPKTTTARRSGKSSPRSCRSGRRWTGFRVRGSPKRATTTVPCNTACRTGATCSRPGNCSVMGPALKSTARCLKPTGRRVSWTMCARPHTGIWRWQWTS